MKMLFDEKGKPEYFDDEKAAEAIETGKYFEVSPLRDKSPREKWTAAFARRITRENAIIGSSEETLDSDSDDLAKANAVIARSKAFDRLEGWKDKMTLLRSFTDEQLLDPKVIEKVKE